MSERLDIILFGASGFTGKHTIPYVYKFAKEDAKKLTWGIAGRSESKLKDVLQEMQTRTGDSYGDVPIILADVNDEKSLLDMAKRAKCVINCAGPYRLYGEVVVKACIDAGTHHVDVSGEPEYMEKMQLKYNELAKEKNLYVASACGYDSVPVDLGIFFLKEKFDGTLNCVETYMASREGGESLPGPSVNTGTWNSAVHSIANWHELRELRSKLYPKRLPRFEPKLQKRSVLHRDEKGRWCTPFLGSDRSVALRSQRHFYETEKQRPVQVETYITIGSLLNVVLLSIFGAVFLLLTKFKFGQNLLLKYPSFFSGGFFSAEGPSEEKQNSTLFKFTLYGRGWSKKVSNADEVIDGPMDKEVVAVVSGSNPGYGATCLALVLSAFTILKEPGKLPKHGGVYPPGALFAKTSMVEKLNKNGLKYEIVAERELKN